MGLRLEAVRSGTVTVAVRAVGVGSVRLSVAVAVTGATGGIEGDNWSRSTAGEPDANGACVLDECLVLTRFSETLLFLNVGRMR